MLHILHAADLHLDAPFAALPPDKAAERRAEQRSLLDRLAHAARTGHADLVLLSGDLLDGGSTYAETAQALSRALGQTGCPVLIAPGNHDYWSPRGPYAAPGWPDNVHIFPAAALTPVELPGLNCTVWGAAFTGQYRDDSPLSGFAAPQDGRTHLGILHGDLSPRSRYGPIAEDEIGASGLAYLALGHIHAASGLHRAGGTYWAYPGCPEGRGFDELGDKGALWVDVDGDSVKTSFLPLAARRYEILEVDITDGPAALTRALPHGAERDCYRLVLTGESDLQGPNLRALEAMAAPYFYTVELRDKTRVRRDLWSRAAEDTLTGLFLRRMRSALAAVEDDAASARIEDAVRFGLAALENGEDRP